MGAEGSVHYSVRRHGDDPLPRDPRGSDWRTIEQTILSDFEQHHRTGLLLRIVHPRDPILTAAIAALDRDDWNPDWPTPFYCRYESRLYGGTWTIIEDFIANAFHEPPAYPIKAQKKNPVIIPEHPPLPEYRENPPRRSRKAAQTLAPLMPHPRPITEPISCRG